MSRKKKDRVAKKVYAYLESNGPDYVYNIAEYIKEDRRSVGAVLGMKKNMFCKIEILGNTVKNGSHYIVTKWASRRNIKMSNWYIASSWKNATDVRMIVDRMRSFGEDVYDFTKHSFTWEEIEPKLTPELLVELKGLPEHNWYDHPVVRQHHRMDMEALRKCDTLVALFPAGNSTHIEIGIVIGREKPVFAIAPNGLERDLLYLSFNKIYSSIDEFIRDQYHDGST